MAGNMFTFVAVYSLDLLVSHVYGTVAAIGTGGQALTPLPCPDEKLLL